MTLPSPGAHDDRGLTALATRRPVGVTMVVLSIALFGVISFERLPRNLMPDITYPSVTVRTEYPGAAPIDVETRVSRRLEEVLAQVRNLRRVSSISRAEASDVIIEFAWDTDMSLAIAEVREKVAQAYLPDEASQPTFLRYDPTLDPILQIGIYQAEGSPLSQEDALIHLRLEAEDRLERELESLPGVAGARVRGGLEREVRVDVDEKLLAAKGVTMALISQRIRDENLNLSSGILYEGEQSRLVRTVNEFADLEEIRDIILRRDGTVPIRLGDVGEVSMGFKDPEVITRLGGRPCVKIDIFKEADANLVEVARRVRERVFGTPAEQRLLAEIREARGRAGSPPAEAGEGKQSEASAPKEKRPAGAEPLRPQEPTFLASRLEEGTRLEVMSDQSVFIQSALDDVRRTVITGGLLAIVVLYLFLRSVWFTLAVGLSIPLSVLATFIVMDQSSVSLNMMSLGGLALGIGMLVDNSVVVLESIFRCRQEGDAPRPAAVRGTRLVASAVTASTLTTVAVFFPIVFVEGIAGQVFREQALTVVISLLASLAVALYFIPAMVSRRLGGRGEPGTRRRPVLRRLLRWHRPLAGVRQAIGRIRATCWRRWDAPLRAIWLFLAIVPLALLRLVLQSLVWAALWTAHLAAVLALGCKERLGSRSRGAPSWFERLIEGLRRSYAGILEGALSHRWLV
ncbi:MAG: efflux RND transporter permease subunit, partial [Planctomycetes bacterium]|nr:efflux RND transporter permease subunit [Planctomycetota bacterium]